MKQRLQKLIRDSFGISRRDSEEWVSLGRVTVNGKVAKLGDSADLSVDKVVVSGKLLEAKSSFTYIVLNKPVGYLTSRYDPNDPDTIYNLLPKEFSGLFPVGRLDKDTEGLLLLTDDGDFCQRLTHPSFEIEKEYYVEIQGSIKDSDLLVLRAGLHTKDENYGPAKVSIVRTAPNKTCLSVCIHEGKNREVRKMFGFLGYRVTFLGRTRIGNLSLGKLAVGKWRELGLDEVSSLVNKKP